MSITRVNLPPLLRAATALHPSHSPHHNSPMSFLRSHPSNILISNPHLFSTFLLRRARPRAAAYPNPQNPLTISNPLTLSISNHHLLSRSLHTHATALQKHPRTSSLDYTLTFGGIAATGGMILMYIYLEKPKMSATVDDKLELSFHGVIPHMYRKGHWVIVDGLARPINDNKISNATAKNVGAKGPWEVYISATEVYILAWPDHVVTAVRRNNNILAVQQTSSEDSYIIPAITNRRTTSSGEILPPDDFSKPSFVFNLDSKYESAITQFVLFTFDKFQDLPKLLREGHSVFVKGFINLPLNSIKSDEINKVRSDDNWPKIVTGRTENMECLFSAEAIAKDDEWYNMPGKLLILQYVRNTAE
ncbi:hypothetical protein ACET3Z_014694 [Daucus carota]